MTHHTVRCEHGMAYGYCVVRDCAHFDGVVPQAHGALPRCPTSRNGEPRCPRCKARLPKRKPHRCNPRATGVPT